MTWSVLVGFLLNALSAPFFVQGKSAPSVQQTTQAPLTQEKVNQKIREIQKVVTRLNIAKIVIPSVAVVGGVVAFAVAALLFIIPAIKYSRVLKRFKFVGTYSGAHDILDELGDLLSPRKVDYLRNIVAGGTRRQAPLKKTIRNLKKTLIKSITGASVVGSVGLISLLGLTAIVTTSIPKLFGLSSNFITKAFDNVKEFEQLEENNIVTLTAQQKDVIIKLKKLQKNLIVRGIIKNLRLKNALMTVVNTAMRQHGVVIGQKKARKIFGPYVKLRWKEEILQKATDEYAAMNLLGKKTSSTQRELDKIKKKIVKIENQYPRLKIWMKNAVKTYSAQANKIMEELKEELIKSVETKKLKAQAPPQQTISL